MSTSSDRGLFVWHEVGTTDLRAGEDFYAKVAGWKAESWSQNPSYKLFVARREPKAGLYLITETVNAVPTPPSWLTYIGTPDVDATVRQSVELGGKVIVSAYNVPSVGRMAHLQDPQGAAFAVSSQEQRSRYKDPQLGDFSWHELLTSNWQTAFDFYSKLFGWEKMESMDMGPQGMYQIFGAGGHQLGGMFNPGGLPPGGPLWIPYFMVADARRTAESAKEHGATVAHGPSEVPGGDWVFTGIDPQGAMFAAHSKKRVAAPVTTKKEAANKETTKTKGAKPAAKKAAGAKKKPARSARLQASRKKTASKRR
jgi:predicted enzyme related to lactoylglutathione lyase